MRMPDVAGKTEFFSYSSRFEPLAFRNGRPKLWAARSFGDEMYHRFDALQGYLSRAAKNRSVRSHESGYAGRGLGVEVGALWTPVIGGISMDTTGDPNNIGPLFTAGRELAHDQTYLLATYMNEEFVLSPDKKPLWRPEMEIFVLSDSEPFCQDVMQIMDNSLPRGVMKKKPERIDIELVEGNEFNVFYNDGLFIGNAITAARVYFG